MIKNRLSLAVAPLLLVLTALAFSRPLISILAHLFTTPTHNLSFFARSATNTIILAVSVGFLTYLVGGTTAWIVSCYDFYGRTILKYMLVLPLLAPTYVNGYIYYRYFDCAAVYKFSDMLNISRTTMSHLYNILCVIFVMTISYYPYVYIITLGKLHRISDVVVVSRTFGYRGMRLFSQVVRYAARPTLLLGVILVVMEVVTEYGLTSQYGVETCVNGIYRLWFSARDYAGGASIAAIIIIMAISLLSIEQLIRSDRRDDFASYGPEPILVKASGHQNVLMLIYCSMFVLLGFILPFVQLVVWSIATWHNIDWPMLFDNAKNSTVISASVAAITVVISLFMGYAAKLCIGGLSKRLSDTLPHIAKMGYAIPGSVVAIGILQSSGSWLTIGGVGMIGMLYACTYRFIGVAHGIMCIGFKQIDDCIDHSIKIYSKGNLLTRVREYAPMLLSSSSIAFALVFIDMIKELPATLIIRPFNYQTLATRVHELVSDERYKEASVPSLVIIIISLVALRIIFNKIPQKHE